MSWSGRHALVTGGTRGIGKATALRLLEAGASVTCWYAGNEEAAEQMRQEGGARLQIHRISVATEEDVRQGIRQAADTFGSITLVANCAGVSHNGLLAYAQDETWQRMIEVNLYGVFHVCREAIKDMIFERWGRIVNVASLSGITGLPGQTAYSAAKGGVIAFTKALAQEVAPYGILANCVSPGLIETEMLAETSEARQQELVDRIPLKRAGQPAEVAELITFLLSDLNTYMTGQNLVISGGLYT